MTGMYDAVGSAKIRYLRSTADQKRTDLDWQDVRIFVALARHGSLSAAARMLSVNHATTARRLYSLEASLGKTLVERRPEGYVLTPAGTHALEAARDMERAAQALGRGMADGAPSGLVRINASPGLTAGFLVSRLPTPRSGAGLALIPHYIGRADPLLRVCDLGAVPSTKDVFLLTRSRDRKNASIRLVADAVAGMFEQERDLFV
jgi:DNA-binding transcriptional LysR family regulator